jgi:hypothetical protein
MPFTRVPRKLPACRIKTFDLSVSQKRSGAVKLLITNNALSRRNLSDVLLLVSLSNCARFCLTASSGVEFAVLKGRAQENEASSFGRNIWLERQHGTKPSIAQDDHSHFPDYLTSRVNEGAEANERDRARGRLNPDNQTS